jgi:hypothetical protein
LELAGFEQRVAENSCDSVEQAQKEPEKGGFRPGWTGFDVRFSG